MPQNTKHYFTYCGRKNEPTFWFCSHFMSFCPIYFIFIGWIAETYKFLWLPRNFDFKPTNEIFSQKRIFLNFQKRPFLGVSCRKLIFWKIGVIDMTYIMDSGQMTLYTTFPNFFWYKSAVSADLSKNQKNHFFEKNGHFLIENLA